MKEVILDTVKYLLLVVLIFIIIYIATISYTKQPVENLVGSADPLMNTDDVYQMGTAAVNSDECIDKECPVCSDFRTKSDDSIDTNKDIPAHDLDMDYVSSKEYRGAATRNLISNHSRFMDTADDYNRIREDNTRPAPQNKCATYPSGYIVNNKVDQNHIFDLLYSQMTESIRSPPDMSECEYISNNIVYKDQCGRY